MLTAVAAAGEPATSDVAQAQSATRTAARLIEKADYKAATGEFSMPSQLDITSASAGDMFMGAFLPGLVLVGLYMAYILISAILKPKLAPRFPTTGSTIEHSSPRCS